MISYMALLLMGPAKLSSPLREITWNGLERGIASACRAQLTCDRRAVHTVEWNVELGNVRPDRGLLRGGGHAVDVRPFFMLPVGGGISS